MLTHLRPRCLFGPSFIALLFVGLPTVDAQPDAYQMVRGTVIDQDTQAPLGGAHVVVLGTDPLLGTMADADGRFAIARVPVGRWSVQARFLGYTPAVVPEVLVTAGKEVVLSIALREAILQGEEVVVVPEVHKEQPLNDLALVSARSFSVEETRRYAGGVDDPARMASAFAGVASGSGVQDNALVIRGNAPKGVGWRLEGVPIPNPNHFAGLTVAGGGGLTLFSSQLLADSDFYTGAFPAEYGDALAGVFDVRFRAGNPARREHAVQLGLLGVDLASEGPFRIGAASTYLFNYRYSTLGLLQPLLPTEGFTTYQDLSFKLSFPTRRAGRLDVWGLGGLDRQRKPEEPDRTVWEYEFWDRTRFTLGLGVGAAGATHHLVLGRRSYLRTTAAATVQRTAMDYDRLDEAAVLRPNLLLRSTSGRLLGSTTLNHKFSARHVLRAGVMVQRLIYDLDLRAAPGDVPPLAAVAAGRGGTMLLAVHAQSRLTPAPRLAFSLGAHAHYVALNGQALVEPRASVRWAVTEADAFTVGYGLHSQVEALRVYFARMAGGARPNRSLKLARAHHLVLGYDRRLGAEARLKVEAYRQRLFDVPVVLDSSFALLNFEQDWTFGEPLVNAGAGRNVGVEMTLERFLRDGYYALLTGSLFRARYRGGDGVWRPSRFDQGYAANALAGKEVALGGGRHLLGVNGRLVAVGGKRRSPIDLAASEARQEVVFDEHRAFAERLPAMTLVDLTVTFRTNRRRFSDVWALQVKNVLAAREVTFDYNYALGTVEEVREGYPLPVLSYKVEF